MSAPGRAAFSFHSRVIHENGNISRVTEKRKSPAIILPWPIPQQGNLIDDAALDQELDRLAEQKEYASSTLRSYRADLRDFYSYCQRAASAPCPCPALPLTVCRYLMHEANQGLALGTITGRLVSITLDHRRAGHSTPCTAEVGEVLGHIRRKIGSAQKPKKAISKEDLQLMLDLTDDDVRGLRDQAILLLGIGSGCRRSELAAFHLADVTFRPEGLILHIARSKTDQEAKGINIPVHRGEQETTCPIRALERWILERGKWEGALFCRVERHTGKITHHRLAPAAIAQAVKRAYQRTGKNPSEVAGHSMRRAYATLSASEGGSATDLLAIKKQLRHATTAMTERYIGEGSLFACNPLKGVL